MRILGKLLFKTMASMDDLRAEIETLKTALASSNEEIARLKQILSDNLPNWEDSGQRSASLPHTVDPEFVSEPLSMSKLTKEDIERYTLILRNELRCPQIQQTAHSSRTKSWRPRKVEGHLHLHLQQSRPFSNHD